MPANWEKIPAGRGEGIMKALEGKAGIAREERKKNSHFLMIMKLRLFSLI